MDRGARTGAGPARWVRFLLAGVLALAVLIGGSFYLSRSVFTSGPTTGRTTVSPQATSGGCAAAATGPCAGSPSGIAVVVPPAVVTVPPAARTHQPGASPSASSRPSSPHPSVPATGSVGAPAGSSAAQGGTAAAQVLALINQARSTVGLPALTVTSGLETSSSAHNLRMADGCGLSHQCPGESPIGDRETAAGVHWTAAGENIGDGGPVTDTPAAIAQLAIGLTQSMLNEQPPNDGHRLNILSSTFTHIGIAVYRDTSGTVWLTQDFSN